ncbi:M10 family metallopeptidase C-terminal domain-containing protein [Baaleninema sp.]|uniref:M10 family metallopeptidase C-terminal domain-containing protein n=1 Tax=Baaleninema sp. TaxID=3101197 RepID=UPI003CFE3DE9
MPTINSQLLNNPTPTIRDGFGTEVAQYGQFSAIATKFDDPINPLDATVNIRNAGSAFVYDGFGNLLPDAGLYIDPSPSRQGEFGTSIALWQTDMLVGARRTDGATNADVGAAYLFDIGTGQLQTTFANLPDDTGVNAGFVQRDRFGEAVDIRGNRVAIGAPGHDREVADPNPNEDWDVGVVHIFDKNSGQRLLKLESPNPTDNFSIFGVDVKLSNQYVLVGERYGENDATDVSDKDTGRAYLFDSQSGTFLQEFKSPNPERNGSFGFAVGLSDSLAVVSAPEENNNSGRVYVFNTHSGNLITTIDNPTPAANDFFGVSVSLSGNELLIGADRDDTVGTNAGAVYKYQLSGSGASLLESYFPTPINNLSLDEKRFGFSVSQFTGTSSNFSLVGTRGDWVTPDLSVAYRYGSPDSVESTERLITGDSTDNEVDASEDGGNNQIDTGDGNDRIVSGDGDDFLKAGRGNDYIDGGGGDDTLVGSRGGDIMTGGEGDDIFVYTNHEDSKPHNYDIITDFETTDVLNLFKANRYLEYVGEGSPDDFTPNDGIREIRSEVVGFNTWIHIERRDNGMADMTIKLHNFTDTLTADNFDMENNLF